MNDAEIEVLMRAETEMLAAVYRNPPCHSWCTAAHEPSEFVENEGVLACRAQIASGNGWAILVEGVRRVSDELDLGSPLQEFDLELMITRGWMFELLDSLPASEVPLLQQGLADVAEFLGGLR